MTTAGFAEEASLKGRASVCQAGRRRKSFPGLGRVKHESQGVREGLGVLEMGGPAVLPVGQGSLMRNLEECEAGDRTEARGARGSCASRLEAKTEQVLFSSVCRGFVLSGCGKPHRHGDDCREARRSYRSLEVGGTGHHGEPRGHKPALWLCRKGKAGQG